MHASYGLIPLSMHTVLFFIKGDWGASKFCAPLPTLRTTHWFKLYFYSFCFIIMTVNYITLSGRRSLQQRSFVVGFFGWDRLHRLRRFLEWLRFLVRYGYVSDSTPMFLYRTYGKYTACAAPSFILPRRGRQDVSMYSIEVKCAKCISAHIVFIKS